MGVMYSPVSPYIKELAKWETQAVQVGDTLILPAPKDHGGVGPYVYRPYPKMLYKGGRPNGTNVGIIASLLVHNEADERIQIGQGWSDGQQAALDRVHADDQELAVQAANRNFHDRRMSPGAQAEAAEVESRSAQHLGAIPSTPIKKKGRPFTQPPAAPAGE